MVYERFSVFRNVVKQEVIDRQKEKGMNLFGLIDLIKSIRIIKPAGFIILTRGGPHPLPVPHIFQG